MLLSKGAQLLRAAKLIKTNPDKMQQLVRNSHHWSYRVAPAPPPKMVLYAAEFVGAFAWWWILWHVWTEPGHITGEFPFPDASQWTDEELGIPAE